MPGGGRGKDVVGAGNSICKGRRREDLRVQGMAGDQGVWRRGGGRALEKQVRASPGKP